MTKLTNFKVFAAIIMFAVSGCFKEEDHSFKHLNTKWILDGPKSGDVYVVGREWDEKSTTAKLWKNGVAQNLSDGTLEAYAVSVFVSDSDVYVAGRSYYRRGNTKTSVAIVWKNGVAQKLTDGSTSASANAVFVYDGDVYVAGQNDNKAVLWKNGVEQYLDLSYGYYNNTYKSSDAKSVYVSGSDIYVAGQVNVNDITLWKNGIRRVLNSGSIQSSGNESANSVFVSGSDVYVTGYGLWKNNERQKLTNGTNHPGGNSVFVSGSDVYVIGNKLWKNGEIQKLADEKEHPGGNSVFVSGADVYVAGRDINISSSAMVWKNGEAQNHLTDRSIGAQTTAESIFVVE